MPRVDTRPTDQWGGRTTSSGVWVGPRRAAGTPNPGSAVSQVRAANPDLNLSYADAQTFVKNQPALSAAMKGAAQPPPKKVSFSSGGSKSGGGGGGRGGGGGGGGGVSAAAAAQAQMDYLVGLLGSNNYTATRNTAAYDANQQLRQRVQAATAQDQQAATGAYNNLDTYLQANQTNPYANVQLQRAAVAPSYNPYLQSQGIAGSAPIAQNPDDGGYAAFQNVLSLLGANQQANNASGLRASQEARTYTGQQIGALDNAYLANVDTRDAELAAAQQQQQMQLDAEKRAQAAQLAALIAQGAKAPDLAALGLA